MGKDAEKVFRELKDDVSAYAQLKFDLLKVNTYERIGRLIAVLSYGLLLSTLALITLIFIMLALGFLFSKWLDSTAAGIGIVAGFYLILVVIAIFNKNRIRLKVMNIVISALDTADHKKDVNTEQDDNNPE